MYGFVQNNALSFVDSHGLIAVRCTNRADKGNFKNLKFTFTITTFQGTKIKVSDPEKEILDFVKGRITSKVEDAAGERSPAIKKTLDAINSLKNFAKWVDTATLTAEIVRFKENFSIQDLQMVASVDCCKCKNGKYQFVNVEGSGGDQDGPYRFNNHIQRTITADAIFEVMLDAATDLASQCPK